jgi:hypothetical protein
MELYSILAAVFMVWRLNKFSFSLTWKFV